mgnify:CR=1 FL=1
MEDITEEKLLVTMLEVTYDKKMCSQIKDKNKLYPIEWFRLPEQLKIKILSQSLKDNCLIKDNQLFKKSLIDNLTE